MVKYNLQINNGVEAFGTTGKTITANEVWRPATLPNWHAKSRTMPKS